MEIFLLAFSSPLLPFGSLASKVFAWVWALVWAWDYSARHWPPFSAQSFPARSADRFSHHLHMMSHCLKEMQDVLPHLGSDRWLVVHESATSRKKIIITTNMCTSKPTGQNSRIFPQLQMFQFVSIDTFGLVSSVGIQPVLYGQYGRQFLSILRIHDTVS